MVCVIGGSGRIYVGGGEYIGGGDGAMVGFKYQRGTVFTVDTDGAGARRPFDVPDGNTAQGALGLAQGDRSPVNFVFGAAHPADEPTGFFVEFQREDTILRGVVAAAFGHRVAECCGDGLNVNEWVRAHCAS